MLRVTKAILHVFDFETGSKYFSQSILDLDDRQAKSYVQRRLRKITANPESRHGEFAPTSNFANGLQEYAQGEVEFVEFSQQIAQWFWEELRRTDDVEQCDLLVADYVDTDITHAVNNIQNTQSESFDDEGKRLFAIVLLPRKQTFIHDVLNGTNEIVRQDATLPSPTQKVDSYAVIDFDTGAIDFHDHNRSVAGEDKCIIPELFLECTSKVSSHEAISEVTVIVQDLAEEYGLEPVVEVSRAKAAVAEAAEVEEAVDPIKVGQRIFEKQPQIQEQYEAQIARKNLASEIPVKRGVANKIAKNHKIRTDTGIEISFPSHLTNRPGYLEFSHETDGRITISIKNIAHIENR
ncbi:MAG: nucleoid-associated protein [Atopobiaceae bacterium]|nr:nucleoid-associated protein [Atopobiaceae bacterium]